jgi:hypothetical protein
MKPQAIPATNKTMIYGTTVAMLSILRNHKAGSLNCLPEGCQRNRRKEKQSSSRQVVRPDLIQKLAEETKPFAFFVAIPVCPLGLHSLSDRVRVGSSPKHTKFQLLNSSRPLREVIH